MPAATNLRRRLRQKIYYLVRLGYLLRCLPFYVEDVETGILKYGNPTRIIQFQVISIIQVLIRIILVDCIGLWYDFATDNLTWHKRIQYYFISSISALSTCLQICTLLFHKRVWSFRNSYLALEPKLREVHNLEASHAMINFCFNILTVIAIPIYFMFFPFFCFGIHFDIHMLALFNTGYWIISIIIGCFLGCITLSHIVTIVFYVFDALDYCFTLTSCLVMSRWNPNTLYTQGRKQELITCYKALQILHYLIMHEVNSLLSIVIAIISGFMTFSLFGAIQFHEAMDTVILIILVGVLITVFIFAAILFKLGSGLTNLSTNFLESFIQNDFDLTIIETMNIKSCRPLYMPIGSFCYLQNTTFPTILQDVVVVIVIELLLAFR